MRFTMSFYPIYRCKTVALWKVHARKNYIKPHKIKIPNLWPFPVIGPLNTMFKCYPNTVSGTKVG